MCEFSGRADGTVIAAKGKGERWLLALASKERLERILKVMLDEDEFFSEHGIRSYVLPYHFLVNGC